MTHSDHDLALIAGYASGDSGDRPAAEELIAGCAECAAEYREQVQVYRLLGEVPAARMSDNEALALTSAVLSQLPAAKVVDIASAPSRKPVSPLWGRLSAVAAALAGVALVGALITTNMGGDGAAATTSVATDFLAQESADRVGDASEPTIAASATTAAASTAGGAFEAADQSSLSALSVEAQQLLEDVESGNTPTTAARLPGDLEDCAVLANLEVVASADAELADRPVLIVIVEVEGELTARAFFADECAEIDLP
jgi:hypothetical protein